MTACSDKPFQWPLRVYIEDTDAGGIVYYVNYLKYMERARTEFMRSLGYDKQFIFDAELMFVVHSIKSDFIKPACLDDRLVATARIIEAGRAFLRMEQNVFRVSSSGYLDDSSELLNRAEVKLTCVDKQTIKPRRIPATLLAAVSST